MWDFALLGLGLIGLWLGAELTIRGALNVAEHFKLSQVFIGLTIVAFGTDLPELFVIVSGAISRLGGLETSGVVIGETIGTSMTQIGLMLGLAALAGTLTVTKKTLTRDGFVMVGATMLFFLMALDGAITRIDGAILVVLYLVYLGSVFREEKERDKSKRTRSMKVWWSGLSLLGGLVVLYFASKATIDSAVAISTAFGISQAFIGVLIVGPGTSLPELATAITAARKKAGALAVSGLIGSNTFDILFALGIGSAISGFAVSRTLNYFDLPALLLMSLLVVALFWKKLNIEKKEGALLVTVYAGYMILKITQLAFGI